MWLNKLLSRCIFTNSPFVSYGGCMGLWNVENYIKFHICMYHVQKVSRQFVVRYMFAWEDCCVEYWCEKTRKCMCRWTGRRDITEKWLKTALNPNQSINFYMWLNELFNDMHIHRQPICTVFLQFGCIWLNYLH